MVSPAEIKPNGYRQEINDLIERRGPLSEAERLANIYKTPASKAEVAEKHERYLKKARAVASTLMPEIVDQMKLIGSKENSAFEKALEELQALATLAETPLSFEAVKAWARTRVMPLTNN